MSPGAERGRSGATVAEEREYDIPAGRDQVVFVAAWAQDNPLASVELGTPDGQWIPESDFDSHEDIELILDENQKRIVLVNEPMAGRWKLQVVGADREIRELRRRREDHGGCRERSPDRHAGVDQHDLQGDSEGEERGRERRFQLRPEQAGLLRPVPEIQSKSRRLRTGRVVEQTVFETVPDVMWERVLRDLGIDPATLVASPGIH